MKPLLLALSALASLPMLAAEPDSLAVQGLQEVTVTGTRTPKTLKDTPVLTRLIAERDIRNADASTLQDLLQQTLPGIEFSYAMNQQTNMNVSGFAGQSVLVLVDGERMAGETMDNVDFSRLTMTDVGRIEVVKGAASALYGSNAAGGVINVIPTRPSDPWRIEANARIAPHADIHTGITASSRFGRFTNSLSADFRTIDSFTVCLEPGDECDFRKVYGHKAWSIKDRFTYSPIDRLLLTARAGYYFKQRYYNVDMPDRYRDFSAVLKAEYDITDADRLEVAYAFDQYDKSDLLRQTHSDIRDYRNVQNSLRGIYTHTFGSHYVATFGAGVMHDYLDSYQFVDGEYHSQTVADAFAQIDWTISHRWEVIAALRLDSYSDTGKARVTAKASARWSLGRLTLRGGYAGGFRAPSLKELYMNFNMADIFDIHGNPDLRAESSHNANLSAEYALGRYCFTLAGSFTAIADRISTSGILYGADGLPFIRYLNVPRLNVFGLEASARAAWTCGISASVAYAFTHERNIRDAALQYCPARPHALTASAEWMHRWSRRYATQISLSGRVLSRVSYTSMRLYEPFEERTVTNPAYTLWKIKLDQRIGEAVTVTLAVDNIFNYVPAVYSFNAPVTTGAALQAGISVTLK